MLVHAIETQAVRQIPHTSLQIPSAVMNPKEACHHLRVSPQLLKWYTSYAPKADSRKLAFDELDSFDEQELKAFDAHLRRPWQTRSVPAGVQRELLVEACGVCALCQQPCEKPQTAHIERKGVEVPFYSQHHDNLILLCGTCHDRYDDVGLKVISNAVVVAAKERLVSRKMEAIDRDVQIAQGVRDAVDAAKAVARILLAPSHTPPLTNASLWRDNRGTLLQAVVQSAGIQTAGVAPLFDGSSPTEVLQTLSGSLLPTQQLTHAVLDGYALEASGELLEAPDAWELLEEDRPEYECIMCGTLKDTVDYDCEDCRHFGSETDPPDGMEENSAGVTVPLYCDARDDKHALVCEECGSNNLTISYPESLCSGCRHMISKDD